MLHDQLLVKRNCFSLSQRVVASYGLSLSFEYVILWHQEIEKKRIEEQEETDRDKSELLNRVDELGRDEESLQAQVILWLRLATYSAQNVSNYEN